MKSIFKNDKNCMEFFEIIKHHFETPNRFLKACQNFNFIEKSELEIAKTEWDNLKSDVNTRTLFAAANYIHELEKALKIEKELK